MAKFAMGLAGAAVTAAFLGTGGSAFAVPRDGMPPGWCATHPTRCGEPPKAKSAEPDPADPADPGGPGAAGPVPAAAVPPAPVPMTVDPPTTHPGGTVLVNIGTPCPDGGVTLSSPAVPAPVQLPPGSPGGQLVLPADLPPGTYPVTATCQGRPVTAGTVTVVAPAAPATGGGGGSRPVGGPPTLAGYGAIALTGGAVGAAALRLLRHRRGRAAGGGRAVPGA
ncbi:hypothetical protein OHV05_33545 [Kitasatospora sp. NBC_00070]|uniref:hypothetical protein n=1 Tax=Kitasatospora sp. NBC_00070 TaxID=2975962 RepID=UPI003254E6EA